MPMNGASVVDLDASRVVTGGHQQATDRLVRAVSAYIREDRNVVAFYIGIASGSDLEDAMWRRYDGYKTDCGFNQMIGLYESSSQDNSRFVEAELEEYFGSDPRCRNRTGGGGGRRGSGPNYYVYLAVRRWG